MTATGAHRCPATGPPGHATRPLLEEAVWRPGMQVQRVRGGAVNEKTGRRRGRLVAKELKTQASREAVALPACSVEAFRRWRTEQKEIRLAAPVWADLDLVFTTGVGTALEPRNVNRAWERVCRDAGTRVIRIHDLRHACASYLAAQKVSLKVIQRTLRHSRASTTEIYLHALEEVPREGADAMDQVIAELREGRAGP